MDFIINTVYYVVPFLFLLGVLVFVHEFGHYIVAKITGVKVAEFSIGFGKMLWGRKDSSGTLWKLSAIPLGGYCKFLGDTDAASSGNDTTELSEEDKKYIFEKPLKVTFHKPCHLKSDAFLKPLLAKCEGVEYIEAKDFDKGIERCKNLPAQILPGGKLEDFFKADADFKFKLDTFLIKFEELRKADEKILH